VRNSAVLLVILAALILGACGGGGSSSGSGESTTAASGGNAPGGATEVSGPEEAWAKEVTAVMSRFEDEVSARAVEQINSASSQPLLEPLFRTYSANLAALARQVEATHAPAACLAARQKLTDLSDHLSRLNKLLGRQRKLDEDEYTGLVVETRIKISHVGGELTRLVSKPHC
jgi:hypothetical protein